MSDIAVMSSDKVLARPLNVLVPLIKEDLERGREASERAGMPYYQAAGEKMIEAKPQVSGGFEAWIKRNFGLGPTQARTYMSYARATIGKQNSTAVPPFTSLNDFKREYLGRHVPTSGAVRRDWQQPVDEIAERARREAERLREESLTRQQEREAECKLALRLIEIGFKVLAKELHPDSGGSRDAMQRLNRVRDRLRQHA